MQLNGHAPYNGIIVPATTSQAASPNLKRIPVGSTVRQLFDPAGNLFHADKSDFIPILEDHADVVALLRPQRWRKTTFLRMVGEYYDVENKNKPVVAIARGATQLANSFSVLHVDLAQAARAVAVASPSSDMLVATQKALHWAALDAVTAARRQYRTMPPFDASLPTATLLLNVANWAKAEGAPLYVLVDEYDALLRHLAIAAGDHAAVALAGRQGPLREFFGCFKTLHDRELVPRMFITGVFCTALHCTALYRLLRSACPSSAA